MDPDVQAVWNTVEVELVEVGTMLVSYDTAVKAMDAAENTWKRAAIRVDEATKEVMGHNYHLS